MAPKLVVKQFRSRRSPPPELSLSGSGALDFDRPGDREISMDNTVKKETAPPVSEIGGRRIGLALSGGGVRAAAFHLGVLRRLAAEGLLERVSVISTVSGGSLVTAAVMAEARGATPGML